LNVKHEKSVFKKSLLVIAISSSLCSYASAQEQASEKEIEVITVTGRAAQFYFINESTMATKTPTSYMDLPQSIQVLSSELIQDQAARQTTDLYRSISGVTQFSYSGITARGFRQDQVRYDGVQGDPYSGFSIPQLFNVERVEVLKGPTGMLYGSGQPGGLLNYVSKKPKFDDAAEVSLFAGNDSLLGGSVDTTGAINESETLAYRFGAYRQSKDSFRNNADEQNTLLSAGLTWLVNDDIDLTLQYDHIDQDLSGHRLRGVPVDDNGNFLTDISYSANENSDFQRLKADVFQLIANTQITDYFTNTTVIRTLNNERTQQYHENLGLVGDLDPVVKAPSVGLLNMMGFPAEDSAMLRQFRDQKRENNEFSITTDFVYETSLFGLEHTLLLGGDYSEIKEEFDNKFSDLTRTTNPDYFEDPSEISNPLIHVPTLDILNPVYSADSSQYKIIDRGITKTKRTRVGVYLQDQIRINEQWIAIAGARFDKFEDNETSSNKKIDDDSISPRTGAIYQPNEQMSIFANRAEGFNPQSLSSQPNSGDIFTPETSIQHELGIKNVWLDGSLHTTFTAYHIVKEDVTVGNPQYFEGSNKPEQVQIGEVTSKGIEVDIVGDITDNWTGTFNYAYNDAKITGGSPDDIKNATGDEFANAPDHTLGLWTRYALPNLYSSVALGADYVSERLSLSGQKIKPYTTWDASWQTRINKFDIQLNLKNIFDTEYATSGFNERNGHFPGEPRSILLQVSYSI
jgi:iron complex outermembrane receptor protein